MSSALFAADLGNVLYEGKGEDREYEHVAYVLWASILELKCSECGLQDRWRGRSPMAVANFARLAGWSFTAKDAKCSGCAGVKGRSFRQGSQARVLPSYRQPYVKPHHCTTKDCTDPIYVPPGPKKQGRPIVKCEKHFLQNQERKQRYLLNVRNGTVRPQKQRRSRNVAL